MTPNKLLSAISLARKAGKLVMGFDAVKESLVKGHATLIFCAGDLSANTRKRVDRFCEDWDTQAKTLPLTQDELVEVCPKRTGVFAVIDKGFAKLILKQLATEENNKLPPTQEGRHFTSHDMEVDS
ncbi:MAG: ribosomal L7Ae/L30e/S12e/Gadd45 family protein [Pygmaiobacter sp.]